ncbi:hypothetical protein FB481_102318 [Pseudomonas sp. AG1028]|uniref:hypothetical protein n=1 Tax=Pseudomonas sp. AG1028 TaxID=2572911 RepID=UPI0011AC805F|nr:hypothetical protein [Pseudomonas sp. AG1028]TWE09786.1 hypothetical protein FB481_102318 [Pseudomonas sp. AG1028]
MRVDKHSPIVSGLDRQAPKRSLVTVADAAQQTQSERGAAVGSAQGRKSAGFGLQLNQQLTTMQSASSYLAQLSATLVPLKLSLSRELGNARMQDREGVGAQLGELRSLLEQRSARSAGSLDGQLNLHLNEPVRVRFSLPGLESLQTFQQAGRESLLFSIGRSSQEPVAVVLDEGLSEEQILRRFNVGLAPAGIRSELTTDGALVFSAREADWQTLREHLRVKGEGALFAAQRFTELKPVESQLLQPQALETLEEPREVRRMLDTVVKALDHIQELGEQLRQRQDEIRSFLARQLGDDEHRWAGDYVTAVYNLMRKSSSSYASVSDTLVAQATISRFTVISLLS